MGCRDDLVCKERGGKTDCRPELATDLPASGVVYAPEGAGVWAMAQPLSADPHCFPLRCTSSRRGPSPAPPTFEEQPHLKSPLLGIPGVVALYLTHRSTTNWLLCPHLLCSRQFARCSLWGGKGRADTSLALKQLTVEQA